MPNPVAVRWCDHMVIWGQGYVHFLAVVWHQWLHLSCSEHGSMMWIACVVVCYGWVLMCGGCVLVVCSDVHGMFVCVGHHEACDEQPW